MNASPEALFTLFSKWKKDGNFLAITLSHVGEFTLEAKASVSEALEDKVTFSFGSGLAQGTLTMPFSIEGVVVVEIVDPKRPPASPVKYDPAFESCVRLRWTGFLKDECFICAFPATGGAA
jgi:hypothetical protein